MIKRSILLKSWYCLALFTVVTTPLVAAEPQEAVPQEASSNQKSSDSSSLAGGVSYDKSELPQVEDGKFDLPRLRVPTISTKDVGNGRLPPGIRQEDFSPEQLPETGDERSPDWNWSVCQWEAPNTFSNPRYFEDRMLERHGHRRFGCFQPAVSGARFVSDFVMLPYEMTIRPGNQCEYTLGYYRPGTCVPGFIQRPPYVRDAALVQAATTAGLMIVFP
ncbi:MAG: hypothetical protein P8L85_22110 [Rubripirellula sp.]|nr:hypothetical protein [Rubripirellula sp.]